MPETTKPPVITIDGPSGVGKGSVAQALARYLGWHILDSGALYRLTALSAQLRGVDLNNACAVARAARSLDVEFKPGVQDQPVAVYMQGEDVTQKIRTESCGSMASKIAPHRAVRSALLQRQRDFLTAPGLIADGRDMGTIVFPEADCKIFLTATAEERARRRYLQLKRQHHSVKIAHLLHEIRQRDERDMNRSTAPLRPADDAILLDTSDMSIEEVFQQAVQIWSRVEH